MQLAVLHLYYSFTKVTVVDLTGALTTVPSTVPVWSASMSLGPCIVGAVLVLVRAVAVLLVQWSMLLLVFHGCCYVVAWCSAVVACSG